jgi:hypothetical protein
MHGPLRVVEMSVQEMVEGIWIRLRVRPTCQIPGQALVSSNLILSYLKSTSHLIPPNLSCRLWTGHARYP